MVTDPANLKLEWCRRLAFDWGQINAKHALKLKKPGFGLLDKGKKLGHWDPNSLEIYLHERLIENHTWDVVYEVLKHEIAHQYACQILNAEDAAPHGAEFQKACVAVGVHPDYRGRSGKLPKFLRPESSSSDSEKSKQLRLIEKLLALAESSQEHEAQAAMEKANALIAKYNLQIVSSNVEQDYDYLQFKIGQKTIPLWIKAVIGIVRQYFFVQTITLTQYDAKTNKTFKAVEFAGTSENLAIAVHAFQFLLERIPHFWSQYKEKTGAKRQEQRGYYIGLLQGFSEKLQAGDQNQNKDILKASGHATTSALVIASDHALTQFYKERYPHAKTKKGVKITFDLNAYIAGMREGKRLTIHKTVQNNDGNRGVLPEA